MISEVFGNELTAPLKRLSGGFLHETYLAHTEKESFVLKFISPSIAARPGALENIARAERSAKCFEGVIPLVTAIEQGGKLLFSHGDRVFLVFPFHPGKSVHPPDITECHCAKIGEILGLIHGKAVPAPKISTSQEEKRDWRCRLPQEADLLQKLESRLCASPGPYVLSHRDLDPKNVLWQADSPTVIDWEAAGPVCPEAELAEVLNYWATSPEGEKALVRAYREHCPIRREYIVPAVDFSFAPLLGWLWYNAGLGTSTGDEQTALTLGQIKAAVKKREHLVRLLSVYV